MVTTERTLILIRMGNEPKLTLSILRRAENTELSLGSLEAIAAIRARLHVLETAAMLSARDKGATMEDIAEALGLTPQAIYYRFRNMHDDDGHRDPPQLVGDEGDPSPKG
jgi:Bacterial regulatory proteins, tetR family